MKTSKIAQSYGAIRVLASLHILSVPKNCTVLSQSEMRNMLCYCNCINNVLGAEDSQTVTPVFATQPLGPSNESRHIDSSQDACRG